MNRSKTTTNVLGEIIPDKHQDDEELKAMSLNSKAMNLLFFALDPNEFNYIQM